MTDPRIGTIYEDHIEWPEFSITGQPVVQTSRNSMLDATHIVVFDLQPAANEAELIAELRAFMSPAKVAQPKVAVKPGEGQ